VSTIRPNSLRRRLLLWIAEHDDSWVFTLLYVGLAVVLSIAISLFWLVAVVAVHGAFEWYAMRHRGVSEHLLGRTLWHLKLDIGLIFFALALGLYLEALFGLVGVGALARTGAQAGARFVAWKHALRGFLMTVDDMAQVAKAVVNRRTKSDSEDGRDAGDPVLPPWQAPWSRADTWSLGFGAACCLAILLAPWLSGNGLADTVATLLADLHPWPPH